MSRLTLVPMTFSEAKVYIAKHHRHHKNIVGQKFCIGAAVDDKIVGVIVVSRPVARMLQDGWTAEVVRCCTDGTKNACSFLYAAAWRTARGMGYKKLITYILNTEPGTSLKASGWKCVGEAGGGSWSRKERPRVDKHPTQKKLRFEIG